MVWVWVLVVEASKSNPIKESLMGSCSVSIKHNFYNLKKKNWPQCVLLEYREGDAFSHMEKKNNTRKTPGNILSYHSRDK